MSYWFMVEIIVNNESLDLLEGEVLALSISINDIGDIGKTKGDYSNSFNIPATSRNLSIIGFVDDLNINLSNTNEFLTAQLRQDGATFREGFISIDGYDDDNKTIEITFYGGNVSWFDDIKEKNLRDIDLTEWNHTYNITNVTNSFGNTEGYIYPLVNHGRITTAGDYITEIYDWMPGMYVHTLVNNIFRDIGYKLKGSFINSDIYKKLIIPYCNEGIRFFNYDNKDARNVRAAADGTQTWSGFSPGGEVKVSLPTVEWGNKAGLYDSSTSKYTVDWGGTVNLGAFIEVTFNVGSTINFNDLILVIKKNGVDIASTSLGAPIAGRPNPYVSLTAPTTAVVDTDYFEVFLRYDAGAPATTDTVTIPQSEIDVYDSINGLENSRVYMAGTLPDVKQGDLLITLFNQFGLIVQENTELKEIEINFFSDVKKNIPFAVDWSNKVDLTKRPNLDFGKILRGYGKVNNFKYKENDDDEALAGFKSGYDYNKGDGFFTLNTDLVEPEKDIFESEFSASIEAPCFINAGGWGSRLTFIPRYSSDTAGVEDYDIDPLPRMLICIPNTNVGEFLFSEFVYIKYATNTLTQATAVAPYAYFDKPIHNSSLDTFRDSLIYSQRISTEFNDALLDTYYKDYFELLENPKLLKCLVDLNPIDIHNLDLNVPVYLSQYNSYFYVNKIEEYTAGSESTRVELIKLA